MSLATEITKLEKKKERLKARRKKALSSYNRLNKALRDRSKSYQKISEEFHNLEGFLRRVKEFLQLTNRVSNVKTVAYDTRNRGHFQREVIKLCGGLKRFPKTYWLDRDHRKAPFRAKHDQKVEGFATEEEARYFARTGKKQSVKSRQLKQAKKILAECGYELRLVKVGSK